MQLTANSTQWYIRWFLWSCRVLDTSLPKSYSREHRYQTFGTNLCHFFRTIMFGTLIAAYNAGMWCAIAFTVLVLPWLWFPAASVATTVGLVIAIVVAAILMTVAAVSAPDGIKWAVKKYKDRQNEKVIDPTAPPGFFNVVKTYIMGIKQKFCPIIKIQSKENSNNE